MSYGKSSPVLLNSRSSMPTGDFSFRSVRAQARERKLADKYRPHCPLGPATAFGVTCVVETWTRPRQSGADPQPPTALALPMEAAELHPGDGLPAAFTNSPLLATPLTPREVAEEAIQGVLESAPMF